MPSLAWFTRSPRFRELHNGAVTWIDENFQLIQQGAGWLDVIRQEAVDFCATSLGSRQFQIPRDPPSVQCQRAVRKTYGADGLLPERLSGLASALEAAGWVHLAGHDAISELSGMEQRHSPVRVGWRPTSSFDLPAGLAMLPPIRQFPAWRWIRMDIEWAAGGRVPDFSPPGRAAPGPSARQRSALYQPLERKAASQSPDTASGAFAQYRHEHEIAIGISFTYYNNPNVNRRPGWMVKRILPVNSKHSS